MVWSAEIRRKNEGNTEINFHLRRTHIVYIGNNSHASEAYTYFLSYTLSKTCWTLFLFTLKVFNSTSKSSSSRLSNSADSLSGMWNYLIKHTARACASSVTDCFFFPSPAICPASIATSSLGWCFCQLLLNPLLVFAKRLSIDASGLLAKCCIGHHIPSSISRFLFVQIFWHRCSHHGKGLVIVGLVLETNLRVTAVIFLVMLSIAASLFSGGHS